MIEIEKLYKKFKIFPKKSHRLKEWLSFNQRKFHQEKWVLRDINLTINSGESLGIVGMNGGGKSTLLKLITKTMTPTSGNINMKGRVSALLELGTGFHPDLTGRQNVLINGKLLGLSENEIKTRMKDIEDFSELGPYFDQPVKTYSSGMYVRLGFSLASSVDPQILIIDEALSVGDAYFQQKCVQKIRDFKKKGVTILFVSHDLSAVKILCDRVALLDQGKIASIGDPVSVLERYNALLSQKSSGPIEHIEEDIFGRKIQVSGNKKAEVKGIKLLNIKGSLIRALTAGDMGHFLIDVLFNEPIENPTLGLLIRDRMGYDVFGTNSADLSQKTGIFQAGDRCQFSFHCKMNLGPGEYTVTIALHADSTHISECYAWVDRMLSFQILPRSDLKFLGVAYLEPTLSWELGEGNLG